MKKNIILIVLLNVPFVIDLHSKIVELHTYTQIETDGERYKDYIDIVVNDLSRTLSLSNPSPNTTSVYTNREQLFWYNNTPQASNPKI
jgi:hypothetical protein